MKHNIGLLFVIKGYDDTHEKTQILLNEVEEITKILTLGILTMKGKKSY